MTTEKIKNKKKKTYPRNPKIFRIDNFKVNSPFHEVIDCAYACKSIDVKLGKRDGSTFMLTNLSSQLVSAQIVCTLYVGNVVIHVDKNDNDGSKHSLANLVTTSFGQNHSHTYNLESMS